MADRWSAARRGCDVKDRKAGRRFQSGPGSILAGMTSAGIERELGTPIRYREGRDYTAKVQQHLSTVDAPVVILRRDRRDRGAGGLITLDLSSRKACSGCPGQGEHP